MGGKASGTGGAAPFSAPAHILCLHLQHMLKWCIWATIKAGIYVTLLPFGMLHMQQVLGFHGSDLGFASWLLLSAPAVQDSCGPSIRHFKLIGPALQSLKETREPENSRLRERDGIGNIKCHNK